MNGVGLPRALLTILVIFLFPALLSAQEVEELEAEGTAAYLAGDYDKAILKYTEAYDQLPNPIFQYNLSLCYGKISNHKMALKTAIAADLNQEDLDDKTAAKNGARIASYSMRLFAETVAKNIVADEQGSSICESDADCVGGYLCADDGVCHKQVIGAPTPQYRERRLGPVGYIGIGLMVVGAGSATAALIVDAGLGPDLESLEGNDLTDSERSDLLEDVSRRQGQGRVLVLVGAGFGIVGAGLLIYDLVTVEKVPVAVAPTISADRVGATVRWNF